MLWWLGVGIAIGLAGLVSAALVQYWADRRDQRRILPPGRLVEVEGRRMHVLEQGTGAPTVVFDSAMGSTSLSWERVQPEVARFTSTLSYDRAGFGWSEAGPSPGDVGQAVADLHQLLVKTAAAPPFVLVGHSYGGFTMRLFADQHPEQVAGLVLIDAADPEQWTHLVGNDRQKIENGARLARRGVWVARLGLARFVVWLGGTGAMDLAKSMASFLSQGMPRPTQNRLLNPMERLSPEARRAVRWFWTRPDFYRALARQIQTVPRSAQEVARTGPYGNLPLTVLAAANQEARWLPVQQEMARLSRHGQFLLASRSSHWIPLDRPDLVVDTIEEMVRAVRARRAAPVTEPASSR